MNLEEKIEYYRRFGWCPLPFRHLPEKIKSIMRRSSWRLQMKQCYRNCQHMLIVAEGLGVEGIEYCEGWFQSFPGHWIPHAWLQVDGKLCDPTLQGRDPSQYEERHRIDFETIRIVLVERGTYGPIEEEGSPPSRSIP